MDDLLAAAIESSADVYRWLPWCRPDYVREDAAEWVSLQTRCSSSNAGFEFVISDGRSRFLGACGLNHILEPHRMANLGYWVRSSESDRGVASAAVRLLADWAFANTGLQRLEILAATENTRSQRVAQRAGASREGILRSRLLCHGRFHDAVVYSIVRESWTAA
jgi:RimJ/RimL family protein N-acetyltransferase